MQFFSKIILTTSMLTLVYSGIAIAINKPCNAHNWHTVTAERGKWKASLQVISESENAWFLAPDCSKTNSFELSAGSPQDYGFAFNYNKVDFNLAYTLTLVEDSEARTFMSSKACVFVVTASSPAQPDIKPISYNHAVCGWKMIPGKGEDFLVG